MRSRDLRTHGLSLLLATVTACGGTSSPPAQPAAPHATPATSLRYADPAGTGWRLVADPSSTSTRIVLNLVGPAGQLTRGVGMNLKAPPGIRFEALVDGLPVRDLGVYELGTAGTPPLGEPVALIGGVKPGNVLSVGVYQKDRRHAAKDSGAAVLQVAFSIDPASPPAAGATIALSVPKAKVIPEDIGQVTDGTWLLDQKMRMADVAVALGTLTGN
jgi:hypothetical protein